MCAWLWLCLFLFDFVSHMLKSSQGLLVSGGQLRNCCICFHNSTACYIPCLSRKSHNDFYLSPITSRCGTVRSFPLKWTMGIKTIQRSFQLTSVFLFPHYASSDFEGMKIFLHLNLSFMLMYLLPSLFFSFPEYFTIEYLCEFTRPEMAELI